MNPPREPAGLEGGSNELLVAVDESEGVARRSRPLGIEGWIRQDQTENVIVILEPEPERGCAQKEREDRHHKR
ncbi:MAG: hypothetical protein EP299_01510 [Acidobacteria bacterium]|nr:MAG: hypothetical protein EP299_01510 [Acidobacteriota bacterium]